MRGLKQPFVPVTCGSVVGDVFFKKGWAINVDIKKLKEESQIRHTSSTFQALQVVSRPTIPDRQGCRTSKKKTLRSSPGVADTITVQCTKGKILPYSVPPHPLRLLYLPEVHYSKSHRVVILNKESFDGLKYSVIACPYLPHKRH